MRRSNPEVVKERKMDCERQLPNTIRVRISIPSFHRVLDNVRREEYTVYKIIIAKPGGDKEILKRYSEFHKLHKSLKELHKLPRGRTIEFPPKKLNPRPSAAVREERRRKLEVYMQNLSEQDPIASEVLSFLGISRPQSTIKREAKEMNNTSSCEDLLDFPGQSGHQPVIGFLKDPFVREQYVDSLNDVLLDGILDGLYEVPTTSPL